MTPAESDHLRSESFLDSCTLVLDQREEKEFHGSQGDTHSSHLRDIGLVDYGLLRAPALLWFCGRCRAHCFGLENTCTMTSAARGRRLASPVRVTLAFELGGDLDGAWWPHTASVAAELPELTDALFRRLGRIIDISVNWSSLSGSPDLDSVNRPRVADPGRAISQQRLMTITGIKALAKLMVIPSRTSNALAVMVLRRAADLPVTHAERRTDAFLAADHIVRVARAESARCAGRPLELDPHTIAPQVQS